MASYFEEPLRSSVSTGSMESQRGIALVHPEFQIYARPAGVLPYEQFMGGDHLMEPLWPEPPKR